MPLLNIVGVTPLDRPYNAGLVFMPGETTEPYCWALQQFRKLLKNDPSTIVMDKELGLMAALNVVFPESRHLLCIIMALMNGLDVPTMLTNNDLRRASLLLVSSPNV